jgi:hypothetical protein
MVESTTQSNSTAKKETIAEDEDMLIESSEKIELVQSFDDLNLNE